MKLEFTYVNGAGNYLRISIFMELKLPKDLYDHEAGIT